jgi:drug/metabolite transporter (DMT)-like permease
MLEFWALQYVSALKTIMIYSATPFVAAALSYFLLGKRLNRNKILGMAIGVSGLLPVLSAAADGPLLGGSWLPSLPEFTLCCAVVASAYAWFLFSDLMNKGYKLPFINGVTMLMGGVMSMATAVFTDGFVHGVTNWPQFLLWVGLLNLTANIIVYNLYGWLLKHYSITFITFAGFLCPTFGALYEWFFMGGVITWHYIASLMLVTAGLTIFYRDELRKEDKQA